MGIRLFGGNSLNRIYENKPLPTDPRPEVFKIISLKQIGNCVLAIVNYPHATNFEGNKILVWGNATIEEVRALRVIDPHFLKSNKIIARFRPTSEGYILAKMFCKMLEE